MKPVSTDFKNAFNRDSMELDAKLMVEFGNNRFNKNATVTSNSVKLANRGIDRLDETATFWTAEDVFNNKNHGLRWAVCDQGARCYDTEDGYGVRAIELEDYHANDYERGWMSAYESSGGGTFDLTPDPYVQTDFDARMCNMVSLYLTPGYPSMKEVSVEYKDEFNVWQYIESYAVLQADEYLKRWTFEDGFLVKGLRLTVHSNHYGFSSARANELQAEWVQDINDYVVSFDTSEDRENYDGVVPIGTTAANRFSAELDNTSGVFNIHNEDSPYYGYIEPGTRVMPYIGINIAAEGAPQEFQYTQMGEYWIDQWTNDGAGTTTSMEGRDFSRFLQDEHPFWARVWRNCSGHRAFMDVLGMYGYDISRLNYDDAPTDTFKILYVKDGSAWDFFAELALADRAMFGFDYSGNAYYESYEKLNNNVSVIDLDWDKQIVDGDISSTLWANSVKIPYSDVNVAKTGVARVWSPSDPNILSWGKLSGGISSSATTISVAAATNQTSGNLTTNGWEKPSGFIWIPEFEEFDYKWHEVVGGELIKYNDRNDTAFLNCERGYGGTTAQAWSAGDYIGEARYWDEAEWENSPVINVKWPFLTCIDTLDGLEDDHAQAHVIKFNANAFTGQLAVGNITNYYTWLMGRGQSRTDFLDKKVDNEIDFFTSVAGNIAQEDSAKAKLAVKDQTPTQENLELIKKYGKKEIEISSPWIQTRTQAEKLAKEFIDEYKNQRRIVNLNHIVTPSIETGDRLRITNYPELGIENIEFHVMSVGYTYDGGLQGTMQLRETKT